MSLSLLHFPPSEFNYILHVFHFWAQIDRFLQKNGNGVNLWVEDIAREEVACHKTVQFVKVDTHEGTND